MKLFCLVVAAILAVGTGCVEREVQRETATMVTSSPTPQPTPAELSIGERIGLHYKARLAKFVAENETLDPNSRYIVFAGDSLTEGFPVDYYFPGQPVLNRGISSDGIWNFPGTPDFMGVLNRIPETFVDTRPKAIFLLIGTNHMPHGGVSTEELLAGYMKIYDAATAANPGVKFVVTTVPPAGEVRKDRVEFNERTRAFNAALRQFARERNLPVIELHDLLKDENGLLRGDLMGDGIHFRPEAYEIWAAEARKLMG